MPRLRAPGRGSKSFLAPGPGPSVSRLRPPRRRLSAEDPPGWGAAHRGSQSPSVGARTLEPPLWTQEKTFRPFAVLPRSQTRSRAPGAQQPGTAPVLWWRFRSGILLPRVPRLSSSSARCAWWWPAGWGRAPAGVRSPVLTFQGQDGAECCASPAFAVGSPTRPRCHALRSKPERSAIGFLCAIVNDYLSGAFSSPLGVGTF